MATLKKEEVLDGAKCQFRSLELLYTDQTAVEGFFLAEFGQIGVGLPDD